MSISVANAEFGGKKFNKEKLPPGRYVCEVDDVRSSDTRTAGLGFFIDFHVVSVLQGEGELGYASSYQVYPNSARGSAKMPQSKAKALEEGKFVVAVAACMGKTRDEVEFVTQERFEAALKRPVSPLKGRKILVISQPYTNKMGVKTSFYEIEPFLGEVATEPTGVRKAPARPAKSATFPPAGWELIPAENEGEEDYFYNESSGETLYEDQLRALIAGK